LINVVGEPPGWVCGRISQGVASSLGCQHTQHPIKGTNIYYPYYFLQVKSDRDIAFFTHYANYDLWKKAAKLADVCVAISERTAEHLPKDKTVVLEIPPDPQFAKEKIVLGINGRDYSECGNDRKRVGWIDKIRAIPGVEVTFTNGKLEWSELPEWYRGVDYVLVISDNEGGPMCVREAIAMGKPVIAPDVGLAWNYPVIRYEGWDGLERTIKRLTPRPDAWDLFIEKVRALC